MILSILNRIQEFIDKIPGFLEKNSANPFFWSILIIVMAGICFTVINRFGDK